MTVERAPKPSAAPVVSLGFGIATLAIVLFAATAGPPIASALGAMGEGFEGLGYVITFAGAVLMTLTICALVAIVAGAIGLKRYPDRGSRGRRSAWLGILFGAVPLVSAVVIIAVSGVF